MARDPDKHPARLPSAEPASERPQSRDPAAAGRARAPGAGILIADDLLDDSAREAPADPLDAFFYRPDEDPGEIPDINADAQPIPVPEESPRELLSFELAGEEYAVDIHRIREIVKVPPITEVPRAPVDVLGVMSLRGEVIPVFDLRRRLGLPPADDEPSKRARVLVIDAGEGTSGVLVDRVAQVVRLKPSSIEATPQGLGPGVQPEYLAGIGRVKNRMYILLDIRATLANAGKVRA